MSDQARSSENHDRPDETQTAMVPRFVAGAVPILNLQRVARSVGPSLIAPFWSVGLAVVTERTLDDKGTEPPR
jgi:hypothetical protein